MIFSSHLECRVSGLVCAVFMSLGAGVRCLQWLYLDHPDAGFIFKILAHTGKIISYHCFCNLHCYRWHHQWKHGKYLKIITDHYLMCIIQGPFVVTLPSIVSSLWFPPHQRTMATGLSWLMLESGNALGFIIGPLMVSDPPNNTTLLQFNSSAVVTSNVTDQVQRIKLELMQFMTLQACVATLLLFLIIVYYPSRPKDLPSFTAGAEREDFLQGLKSFMTNKNAVMVCCAFTLSQGVAESFYPVLDLNFAPIGVSESTTGSIGFIASVVASITAFLISFFVERMKGSYKWLLIILLALASCFYMWQTLLVTQYLSFSYPQLYCSTIAGSAINYACTPLMLELASEVAYPVGEGVVSGKGNLSLSIRDEIK